MSSACRACLHCAPPRSPPIYLPFEINININHPDLHLSLLLYPHHVRLDQQFVDRPISCQWVIGDLQEKVFFRKLVDKQIRNHLHANPEKCSTRHNLLFVILDFKLKLLTLCIVQGRDTQQLPGGHDGDRVGRSVQDAGLRAKVGANFVL